MRTLFGVEISMSINCISLSETFTTVITSENTTNNYNTNYNNIIMIIVSIKIHYWINGILIINYKWCIKVVGMESPITKGTYWLVKIPFLSHNDMYSTSLNRHRKSCINHEEQLGILKKDIAWSMWLINVSRELMSIDLATHWSNTMSFSYQDTDLNTSKFKIKIVIRHTSKVAWGHRGGIPIASSSPAKSAPS